jgi:tetratricopeptide (TPR) repeat protein
MRFLEVYVNTTVLSARRIIARCFGLAVLAAALLVAAPAAQAFRNVPPGSQVPSFTLTEVGGAQKSLADFAGKGKIMVFFSGNDRSKKVMQILDPLYQKYKGDGLEVIAIYTGSDKAEAKAIAEASKATFSVFNDPDKQAYGDYGVAVTPVMALVDKTDKLLKEQAYVPLLEGILETEIKVILGKMSREDADLSLKPEEAKPVSEAEKEADKIYSMGLVLLERGMKDKAMEKFKQVLTVDPAFCKVRLQLGHLYIDDGKIDEAKAEFEYVLKCDPGSHEAKVGLGTVLGQKGEFDKAIEMLDSSLQLNPRVELAYYELGRVYEKKGVLDKAVDYYRKALDKLLTK